MSALDDFLAAAATEVARRAEIATDRPVLAEGARAFATALAAAGTVERDLTTTGVRDQLNSIDTAHAANPALASLAVDAAREVPWVPTPRIDGDAGATVGLGLVDKVRDFGEVTVGFMLLAPGAAYPEHTHPPQEIYLPLTGEGQWRFGGADDYVRLADDALVYNNPGDLHGVVAADEPELALYFLWP